MSGVFHVIMAGGSGTRFWPLSRASRPKQFLTLASALPLIREAWERAADLSGEASIWIAAGASHRAMVRAALPDLPLDHFIAEPCARNTAPCVGLSALLLQRADPEAVMVVSPADHVYTRPDELRKALKTAIDAARAGGALVTLGIKPLRPETGYGYIEIDRSAPAGSAAVGAVAVRRFVEKPDAATASRYVASGDFLWNSGVFIWKVSSILKAIQACAPELWKGLALIDQALGTVHQERIVRDVFGSLPSISIDYAVLEKASEVLVVPTDPGWSDVGSWDAVAELRGEDAPKDAVLIDANNCFIESPQPGRIIAVIGVDDLIVVDTPDALLICRKGESQEVRRVVEALKAGGRDDLL